MTDLILHADPLEFQNSRQSTKIMFLQQELAQVQDHVKDLEHIVRINKEALRIAMSQQISGSSGIKKSNSILSSAETADVSVSYEKFHATQKLCEYLQEENTRLLDMIDNVKKERNIAQSKALISEQILEEAQRHELEITAELEEKISDLRKLLQDKEYAIQELEKIKPIPEQEGVVIKYREVLNPTEQTVKLHNEIDALNGMLNKVSKELNKLQGDKQELQAINSSLTSELAKARSGGPLQAKTLNMKGGQKNNIEDDLNNSDIQAAIFNPGDEDGGDMPLPSYPDKIHHTEGNQPKIAIPKLDFSKAKQIQEQIAKKITAPPAQATNENLNPKYVTKISQLEDELILVRKRLSNEMINNKLLSDELANVHRYTKQVVAHNELLIKSNKRYEEKWQKTFYTLEFYRDFYRKYIDFLTKQKTQKTAHFTPRFDNLPSSKANFNLPQNPDLEIRNMIRNEGGQFNPAIMEAFESDEPQSARRGSRLQGDVNKEQCKAHLLDLAKEIYVNERLSNAKLSNSALKSIKAEHAVERKGTIRHRRSTSNPLEYVFEGRNYILVDVTRNLKPTIKGLNAEPKETGASQTQDYSPLIAGQGNMDDFDIDDNLSLGGGDTPQPKSASSKIMSAKLKMQQHHDEGISFTVDAEEFNKNKLVEVSFISNHDILDHIKQDY